MLENVLLRPLDIIRARILRKSVKFSLLKWVFVCRHVRSNCIVSFSIILNLVLMVYCPLWTLLIAPSILGMAHLIESLSSFHDVASPRELKEVAAVKKRAHQGLGIFCLVFFCFRLIFIFSDFFGLHLIALLLQEYLRILDMSVVMLAFLYFCHLYNIGIQKRFCGALCLSILGYLLVGGGVLWGCFIFAHNFMAFAFWYYFAPSPREKFSCLIFLSIFALIHIAVLAGWMDDLWFSHTIDQRLPQGYGYSFYLISSELFPGTINLHVSRKIVSLLCFGQGVHYILWLRVIPECRLIQEAPLPFRTSFKKRTEDWGYPCAFLFILLLLGFLFAAIIIRWDSINELFFGLAFFHIYAEFLSFLCNKLTRRRLAI